MFLSLLLYMFGTLALAADTQRIAVLEFRTMSTSISDDIMFFFGDAARQGVREGLPLIIRLPGEDYLALNFCIWFVYSIHQNQSVCI